MATDITSLTIGDALAPSPWIGISQDKIDLFAKATGDFQWIHVDADRCQQESPFKQTIAHGLLSTSLMPSVFYNLVEFDADSYVLLNYGIDSLRFLEPVRVNDNIRFKVSVDNITDKPSGRLYRFNCEVEIENRDTPAMVGTFLMLLTKKPG